MPELTPERLRELRRLHTHATRGPFAIHRYDCDDGDINYQLQQDGGDGVVLTNMFESTNEDNRSDAAYLLELLNTAPALLDAAEERDRLQVELDELKALASKSELAMAEDWRLATIAAAALMEERNRLRARVTELEEEARLDKGAFALVGSFIREINKLEHCALTSIARMHWALLRCPGGARFDTLRNLLAEGVLCGREILQQAEWQAEGKEQPQ